MNEKLEAQMATWRTRTTHEPWDAACACTAEGSASGSAGAGGSMNDANERNFVWK